MKPKSKGRVILDTIYDRVHHKLGVVSFITSVEGDSLSVFVQFIKRLFKETWALGRTAGTESCCVSWIWLEVFPVASTFVVFGRDNTVATRHYSSYSCR